MDGLWNVESYQFHQFDEDAHDWRDYDVDGARTAGRSPQVLQRWSSDAAKRYICFGDRVVGGTSSPISCHVNALTMRSSQVLTRRQPFQGMSEAQIQKRVITGERPPVPLERRPHERIWAMVLQGWHNLPNKRPSCADLEQGLRVYRKGEQSGFRGKSVASKAAGLWVGFRARNTVRTFPRCYHRI